MLRIFLVVLGAGIVILAAGMVYLGTMPLKPMVQEMHVVLPTDRFGGH